MEVAVFGSASGSMAGSPVAAFCRRGRGAVASRAWRFHPPIFLTAKGICVLTKTARCSCSEVGRGAGGAG